MRKVVVIVSSVLLVVSVAGAIVSLVLNAFVFDKYDAYGEVPIPGSSTLHLPAGDVTVSFHTQVIGKTGGGGLPVPPLRIGFTPPDGVADPEFTENRGSTTSVNNDTHVRVGFVHITKDGDYTVHVQGTVTAYVSPALSFGHGSTYGYLTWVFAGMGAASLLVLLATIFFWRRTPRPVLNVDPTFSIASTPADPYVPTDQGIRLQQLKTLASLHESGALTDEEFETEKRRILGQ
jgi:Short C-terminal domain